MKPVSLACRRTPVSSDFGECEQGAGAGRGHWAGQGSDGFCSMVLENKTSRGQQAFPLPGQANQPPRLPGLGAGIGGRGLGASGWRVLG